MYDPAMANWCGQKQFGLVVGSQNIKNMYTQQQKGSTLQNPTPLQTIPAKLLHQLI